MARIVRAAMLAGVLLLAIACAPVKKTIVAPPGPPLIDWGARIAAADALYARGHYTALRDARRIYEEALAIPERRAAVSEKFVRSAVALGLRERCGPELIVCPTCGRTEIDVIKLARRIQKAIRGCDKPLRVAVMGCVVNGPGEAADADLAVCAAKNKAFIYRAGRKVSTVPEDRIIPALMEELQRI